MKSIIKQKRRLFFLIMLIGTLVLFNCSSDDNKEKVEICDNGVDDDLNGFIDCEDSSCAENSNCD